MKNNIKSSITLPPAELAIVEELAKKLKAKSKVEVIRRGLTLLKQTLDRSELKSAFAKAAEAVQKYGNKEIKELDKLSDEGLD